MIRTMIRILLPLALALLCAGCSARVKQYKVEVVKEYPHDTGAYTQGLFFDGGRFF